MALVTDSFCERCGSHYVFSPSSSKGLSLKGARVLARSLKNFVLTDGQSMSDAITLARLDDEREDSTRLDEAFHKTFNFCMTCRQYACDRCWNASVGACLSCAPEPDAEPVAPEKHLIVRTPVARWDSDWSLEPDGPAVEPLIHPAEATFVQEIAAPAGPSAPAWPVRDLPNTPPAADMGPGSNHSSRQPKHDGAWTLWPIADEISPKMTLTPDELAIIEARLSRIEDTPQVARPAEPPVPPQAEPQFAEQGPAEPLVALQAAPQFAEQGPAEPVEAEQGPAERVATEQSPAEAKPVEAEQGPAEVEPPLLAGRAAWVTRNVEAERATWAYRNPDLTPELTSAAAAPAAEWDVAEDATPATDEPAVAGFVAEETGPADEPSSDATDDVAGGPWDHEAPHRVLRISTADPDLPPLTPTSSPPASKPATQERTPIVARLLGRRAPAAPVGDPWPQPTQWSDRPIEPHDWWGDAAANVDDAETTDDSETTQVPAGSATPAPAASGPATADPAPAPAATATPTLTEFAGPTPTPAHSAPLPSPAASSSGVPTPVDAREAVAMRISAVAASSIEPATPPEVATAAEAPAPAESAAPAEPAAAVEPVRHRVAFWARPEAEPAPVQADQPLFDLPPAPAPEVKTAPSDQPVWRAVDPRVADAARAIPSQPIDRTQVRWPAPTAETEEPAAPPSEPGPAPAAPWPPLGASWPPATARPTAPWPAPEVAPVPAVVAAQQLDTSKVAEMWAQSAQEVLNRGSVRVCHNCALPVSTHARFCRRCGTQQA